MLNWRELKAGDKVTYGWNDFDGCGSIKCVIGEVFEGHAVAMSMEDREGYYLDDDTADMFRMGW